MAALLAGMCSFGYAQDYLGAPKTNEKVLGTISIDRRQTPNGGIDYWGSKVAWYSALLTKAKQDYPGKVVEIGGNPESQTMENLSKAMDKAFRNVREGSRVAIDMVTVSGGVSINREDLKDQIIDALLDKGYKVVAKDYLEKMYEEQEAQQSGIYNESTTVKPDNFSAVGYYINVKVTETSLRVQVVNVSTGEYEGNATVNF